MSDKNQDSAMHLLCLNCVEWGNLRTKRTLHTSILRNLACFVYRPNFLSLFLILLAQGGDGPPEPEHHNAQLDPVAGGDRRGPVIPLGAAVEQHPGHGSRGSADQST